MRKVILVVTGNDGISPTVTVSKENGVTTIVITDANGEHTATINDGQDGQDGEDVYVSYNSQEETLIINTMQDGNEVEY